MDGLFKIRRGFTALLRYGILDTYFLARVTRDPNSDGCGSTLVAPLVSPSPSFKLHDFSSCEGLEC